MTTNERFDRTVADWLHEDARQYNRDHLAEVLGRTSRVRQRPWWSSHERWLPVQLTMRLAPVPRMAWLLVILALIVALAVAVLAVGSRPHLPPPFGLARNGAILYGGTDHDIHTLDPVTGATAALITGSSSDRRPMLSPDGTRVLFLRDTTTTDPTIGGLEPMVMVANADGTDVRPLTGALANFDSYPGNTAWSHDGAKVAVSWGVESTPALQIFAVDGSTTSVVIDTRGMTAIYLSFRPGDRELTFRGSTPDGDGMYAVGVDGLGLRTILPPSVGDGASLSPDGTKIAYQVWDGTKGVIHVVDVQTGIDSIPVFDPPSDASLIDDAPMWSPDGTRFLFVRYAVGANNHLVVSSATGGRRVEIGPAMPNCGCPMSREFSPDGSKVLAHYDADGSTWLLDPTGATAGTQLPTSIAETSSWQRLAP